MSSGICEYCGRKLEPIIVSLMNGKPTRVGWCKCGCDGEKEAEAEIERRQKEWTEMTRRLKLSRSLKASRIPKRYSGAKLNDLSLYETAFKDGLYIFGGVGTGKTTNAAAIGIRALENGKSVLFYKAYELSSLSVSEIIELSKVDLLIIDDIGSDNTSEWGNTRLRIAIDSRYDSMLPIVITSNYSKEQLTKLLLRNVKDMTPKAIVSRLTEMTVPYELSGEDLRK